MATVNLDSIVAKLSKATKVKQAAFIAAKRQVSMSTEKMLKDFDSHKVTKEIEDGESTNNSSNLLYGYGNLFSFIGFNEGDDPIGLVRNILRNTKLMNKSATNGSPYGKGKILFRYLVKIPSLQELYEKTEYPGETRSGSWLEGIESGLYGLRSYLYNDDGSFEEYGSRSGTGLQAKAGQKVVIIRKGEARSIKYITQILKDFARSLNKR